MSNLFVRFPFITLDDNTLTYYTDSLIITQVSVIINISTHDNRVINGVQCRIPILLKMKIQTSIYEGESVKKVSPVGSGRRKRFILN